MKRRLSPQDGASVPRRSRELPALFELHASLSQDRGAAVVAFSPDSTRMIIGTVGGRVVVLGLDDDGLALLKVFEQHIGPVTESRSIAGKVNGQANGTTASDEGSEMDVDNAPADSEGSSSSAAFGIVALAVSEDVQWLASVDRSRRLHVYSLDSLQHHCTLPSPALPPTCMIFLPSSPSTLVVGLPNNTLHFFDVERNQLASWARRISAQPFTELTDLREPMIGLSAEPPQSNGPQVLVAWGSTWTASMRLPEDDSSEWPAQLGRKRRREAKAGEVQSTEGKPSMRVSHKHQALLAFSFIDAGELVAVERPFSTLVGDLPKAFVRPGGRYGT